MNKIKGLVKSRRERQLTQKKNRNAMNKYRNTVRPNYFFSNNKEMRYLQRKKNKGEPLVQPYNTRPSRLPSSKLNITKSKLHRDRTRPNFVKKLWPKTTNKSRKSKKSYTNL